MPRPIASATALEADDLALIAFARSRGWSNERTRRALRMPRATFYRRSKTFADLAARVPLKACAAS